jgi:hypothetical protein
LVFYLTDTYKVTSFCAIRREVVDTSFVDEKTVHNNVHSDVLENRPFPQTDGCVNITTLPFYRILLNLCDNQRTGFLKNYFLSFPFVRSGGYL